MHNDLAMIRFPELVIGVAGPIGIDIEAICESIEDALRTLSYESVTIKLTEEILAAGIKLVVFMEPYPKSKAKELHSNEIEVDIFNENKVSFIPFIGISPYRYRDIFEKAIKRKTGSVANKWYYDNEPCPMIDVLAPSYTELERFVLIPIANDDPQGKLQLEPKA